MQIFSHFIKLLLVFTLFIALGGCGYKPSAKYARDILGNKISTSVTISAQDPENTVIIKDAVDLAIVEVFHASLRERQHADTHLSLILSEPQYTPLQYNNNGYIISYRATIHLKIIRESKDIRKSYTTKGAYDFAVEPNAVLTDQERFDAIKYSSIKAISGFVAKVSAEGSNRN